MERRGEGAYTAVQGKKSRDLKRGHWLGTAPLRFLWVPVEEALAESIRC